MKLRVTIKNGKYPLVYETDNPGDAFNCIEERWRGKCTTYDTTGTLIAVAKVADGEVLSSERHLYKIERLPEEGE